MSEWRQISNDDVSLEWYDLAIKILDCLKDQEKYSLELSRELSCNQQSASNYLSDLCHLGLVQRTKRTQAQYYEITDKGQRFLENYLKLQDALSVEKLSKGDLL